MASHIEPQIYTYKADGVIAKGSAVKIGTDRKHVAIGAANTDKCIGIAQSASAAAEDLIEIAVFGGGAKAIAGETIAAGKYVVSHTDGTLVQSNAANDFFVGIAMESAVVNDIFSVQVVTGVTGAADQ